MATLATVCGRFLINDAVRSGTAPRAKGVAPVRTFANEDIYFFVKRIDNSRLVRQAEPGAPGVCWRTSTCSRRSRTRISSSSSTTAAPPSEAATRSSSPAAASTPTSTSASSWRRSCRRCARGSRGSAAPRSQEMSLSSFLSTQFPELPARLWAFSRSTQHAAHSTQHTAPVCTSWPFRKSVKCSPKIRRRLRYLFDGHAGFVERRA